MKKKIVALVSAIIVISFMFSARSIMLHFFMFIVILMKKEEANLNRNTK
jgi:hypothetical protein